MDAKRATTIRALTVVLSRLAALLVAAAPAGAQPIGDPYNVNISTTSSPYWGYTYTPYIATPLQGAAMIIQAHGDFMIKTQQAGLMREQVRMAKLQTRRAELEQWVWEREYLADFRDRDRKRIREAEVERARTLPPLTEIVAAVSLNNLLDEIKTKGALSPNASTPVEAEWLAHVHTTVDGCGNAGLLKDDRLFWPQLLRHPLFNKDREQIEQLFIRTKKQALSPERDAELLRQLRLRVAGCQARMREELHKGDDFTLNSRHFVEAKRLMQQLEDAITILERPDAGFLLNPLQGKTVAELVANMTKQGIRFAPATLGCERYYVALHRALADEVTRLQGQR